MSATVSAAMILDRLDHHRHLIPSIAEAQFGHWGPLTGFNSASDYRAALDRWSLGVTFRSS